MPAQEALSAVIRTEYDKRPAGRYPNEDALAEAILASGVLAESAEQPTSSRAGSAELRSFVISRLTSQVKAVATTPEQELANTILDWITEDARFILETQWGIRYDDGSIRPFRTDLESAKERMSERHGDKLVKRIFVHGGAGPWRDDDGADE